MKLRSLFLMILGVAAFSPSGQAAEPTAPAAPVPLHTAAGGLVWVYLPAAASPGTKLACVLVPPAGTRLFHGMTLNESDQAEHVPYVAAGFAVVSFDISGPLPDDEAATVRKALADFKEARFGVTDALEALRLVLGKYPQIDPQRVYIAGHSSAATLALQVAESSDQIRACVAYAPIADVAQRLGDKRLASLDRLSPGFSQALREASPSNRVEALGCPLFLFHAEDDTNVRTQSILAFRAALDAHHKSVKYVSVASGGHYESMIEEGIPQAIAWLKAMDQSPRK